MRTVAGGDLRYRVNVTMARIALKWAFLDVRPEWISWTMVTGGARAYQIIRRLKHNIQRVLSCVCAARLWNEPCQQYREALVRASR